MFAWTSPLAEELMSFCVSYAVRPAKSRTPMMLTAKSSARRSREEDVHDRREDDLPDRREDRETSDDAGIAFRHEPDDGIAPRYAPAVTDGVARSAAV